MAIKKIFITGDSQRPIPPQNPNIHWLHDLLSVQIEIVTGIKPIKLISKEVLDLQDWLRSYKVCTETVEGLPNWYLFHEEAKDLNYSECLFIGFELPWVACAQFSKLGAHYIDITAHPVRFMEDLLLAIKTSYHSQDIINKFKVPDSTVRFRAQTISSQLRYSHGLSLPNNTALILGQTDIDRSLFSKESKILSLSNFSAAIDQIFKDHTRVLFKPHPHNWNGFSKQLLMERGAEVVSKNIYQLLSHSGISSVYGISSSGLYEAEAFGKQVCFLGERWCDGVPVAAKDYLNCSFWREILLPIMPHLGSEYGGFEIQAQPNRVRKSCNAWWGFEFVEDYR